MWVFLLSGVSQAHHPGNVGVFGSPQVRGQVELAIRGAEGRLREPECLRILNDFHDAQGKPLLRVLEARNVSATDFLTKWMRFRDGRDETPCQTANPGVAVTRPGSVVVYICSTSLAAREMFGSGRVAEAAVIHEMLHALGLPENPPSSREITNRVLDRCGKR